MGLLKFGLCVVTWIILCVSKTNAENKSIENNGTRCVEGQDILQTDPCIKCVCVHGTSLCENVPCDRKRKNGTRSGPDTKLLNEKVIPPDLTNRRRLPYNIPNKNEAIQPSYQKPHMSSYYTKDSKIIEERRPNISTILTQTREENILNTFLPQSLQNDGNKAVNNDDNYILIVPDEESEMHGNFQAQIGQSVNPTAFELPPGVPRPLARQPFVFGRPGDKRLLMRPRHFMRNSLKNGMKKYTQKDFTSSNINSNWKNKFNQQGAMSYPQNSNGNSDISVYTPSQSAPFKQSEYYYPKQPIIYNDQKTNNKHFVDGKVRWKLANDYPGDQMPQNNNGDQPEPMSDSESSVDIPNNNDRIRNQSPGAKYPISEFPGGKYPGGKYPISMYPGGKYPGGKYPNGQYPGMKFPDGKYPAGKYPSGSYPEGKYPSGNYPVGKYPGGKYPNGNYPDGKYPGGKYPDGNYPDGKYPGGKYPNGEYPGGEYPGGNYPDGKYPGGKYPDGNYPDGKYQGGKYPDGKYPDGKYPGGKYPDGNYPDGKYPGGIYPDGKYPDGKYPGGKYPDGNYPDGKYPGGKYLDGKYPDGNYPDGKYPGGNYPDGKYPGGKYPDGKYPGGKYPDGNYPDGKYPGGKYPDGNYPDGKYPGGQYPGGNYPNGEYPVGKYPGGNYPDGKYPGGKYPGGIYPDGKYPGGKYPDGNYPNGEYPGGKHPGGDYPEGKYPGGKYPDGNYPAGKYPSGNYPDGKYPGGNYPGGIYPDGKSPVGKYPEGKYPDGNYPGGSYPNGNNPGQGSPNSDVPGGSYPGGIYPGGDNSGSKYPGGDNPNGGYPGGQPGGKNPDGSIFDQSNPLSPLENNDDLSLPDGYPEKMETTTVKYTEYKWQKKQRRKKKKPKKQLLALDEVPLTFADDYPPNPLISQAINKKKKIIKKKRKIKKKKQFMLYLDDDDDKKPTNEPTYDESYPESDSPSYPDDDSPPDGNIPANPDYGTNPIKQFKRPQNTQLPGNLQPFRPNENGFMSGVNENQKNPPPPSNSPDYPIYPGQDKSTDYKKHKLHKKKTFGLYDEPESPIKIPNNMSPQNKFPRPQAPGQNLKPPVSNYKPFQPRPLSDDVFPNSKDKTYMLSTPKTPYSVFSSEMSKKKRKRKKKKNKNIMLSALDTPDPDYPELSADLAKKIKDLLLSTQKPPTQDYPKITPELIKQIKNILLTTPTPSQDYSLITPELAKKLKQILLTTQKTPYPHPLLNKLPAPIKGFPQNPKRPNEPSLGINSYKPQRPKVPEMYPDYEPDYPDMPKKPGNKNPFLPVSLGTKPQNYPDYDTNPMMYDYPHITEKPEEIKPIVPQMYKPQNPNPQPMPVMYDEIKPKSVQTLNSKPKQPVGEIPIMPVINYNLPEKYPGYPSKQVAERPIVPHGIYPNQAQPKPNKYDNIPDIEAIESSIIPQTHDNELQMYPGYKPKPKRPIIDNKPKMYPDYEPAPIIPQYPTEMTENPIIPIEVGDEPQMYPANQYPGRPVEPLPKKPSSPVTYDSGPELYIDDTPTPFIKPQPYKPQRPLVENPIIPVSLGSEPQMYPDFNPKPQRPVAESPIMPVSLGNELQMYPDFNPKPGKPFGETPIIPVNLGSEPQMYPDYNQPKKPMSEKPGVPVYDIEPEIYIDDTPEPLLNQSPPQNPLSEGPLLPVTYDSEPQMYSDNEPTSMTLYKPRKPITEEAIIPQAFDNKLQMYPDYKSVAQQPVDDTPPSPANDFGPEVYIDDTPTPTDEYDQTPQQPVPESFITPGMYDNVPEIYPADETAILPVNSAPEIMTNEPSPNNEPIPVFSHYNNLPEYGQPQNNNVPPEPQTNNKNPEMYPDTNIPVFNNYPDLNKNPPNNSPQLYTPPPPTNMPFTEVIPVFNSYPDLNKNPTNPQTFNKPPPSYPDYSVPIIQPKIPDYGRPQLPQPLIPMIKPKIPTMNKIYDIKMMKPNSSPPPKLLPFGIPQSEQYLLELKKKRLSKVKHNNVRPTISMPYIGEGIENILDLSRFTDDMYYTQTHLKKNMCKLCQLLDCIHPKRPNNPLFPAIKILNEENELSDIIYKMLSKMRNVNNKYSHAPFTQEFEIIMPPALNQNKGLFNQFKPSTNYFDEGPLMPLPFMFPFGWPNSQDNEMAIFNKFKTFKDDTHKNLFDEGIMKPHMFPGVMPFIPKPFNFGSSLPNFNNFMPFPSNKFRDPLAMMSSLPVPGMPMSMAEPTISMPIPIPSVTTIIGDKINTPLPDLNSIPPQNFNMGPDMGILSDDPMEHDETVHFEKPQEANPDNFIESDFLNYTWQNPNVQGQGLGDPTGGNILPESGQDGSLIPFDYFKSQNEVNATSSSQINSANADITTTDGTVAADPKVVNAQRIRSKRLKRLRTNDGDLTYARKSKGC